LKEKRKLNENDYSRVEGDPRDSWGLTELLIHA
jgi:hypothetical protein